MTDIEIAKSNLSGHTICLCKDGNCLYSERRGIAPMMNFIASGTDMRGYSVADLVVGKAAAMLFILSEIKSVFAKTLSKSGEEILKRYEIPYEYETLTDKIINRDGSDICPMEKAISVTEDPQEAYSILSERIKRMSNGK